MHGSLKKRALQAAVSLALLGGLGSASAVVNVQCPGDLNGDADWDDVVDGVPESRPAATKCMHLIAGDGFSVMSDNAELYTFGFGDQTGAPPGEVIANGILNNQWPGPTIELEEGDQFYLSLTNVGTTMRPDLFDPHTVHFHGFPNAATVFDGVPEVSISINMGGTLTNYYNIVEPGTYLYHCHVEATEHMEMGMLANLYVHPRQDYTGCLDADGTPNGACGAAPRTTGGNGGYVFNDGDGSTAWDREKAIQLAGFDSHFHEQHIAVQPLPFYTLKSDYPQFNGRGYPDTIDPSPLAPPPSGGGQPAQVLDSRIEVAAGQTLLLRLSNVGLDRFWTLTAPGLTFRQVGTGARHMRGPDGKNLYVETASIHFGGGESMDVLVDTTGVPAGTYFLHATELHQMSNRTQMDGGMITEIVVN
jgi:FtsP/CotA-like multicopper oxidase with cupredoxin domain